MNLEITPEIFEIIVSEATLLESHGVLDEYELNLEAIQNAYFNQVLNEAEYRGREVKLGKPTKGDIKKFKVFVKDKKTGTSRR